jgi:prolyl oligopeptidase
MAARSALIAACTFTGTLLLSTPLVAIAQAAPPPAEVRDVVETHYGTTVHDPYRYFENLKDPAVVSWMKAQSDYARAILDRIPQRATLLAEIQRYGDAAPARVNDVQLSFDHVYYEKRLASEDVAKLYVRQGLQGTERLVVDPVRYAKPGTHAAIDYYAPSLDNRYVAVGISEGGSEESLLHVIEVATGKEVGDAIDRASYAAPAWLPDGRLVYSRMQNLAPNAPATDKYLNQRIFVHRIGDGVDADAAIFGAGVAGSPQLRPLDTVSAMFAPGSTHLVAIAQYGDERELRVFTVPLAILAGEKTPWKQAVDIPDGVISVAAFGDDLYAISHQGAPRFKVVKLSLVTPSFADADVVVPQSAAVVTGVATAADALYVRSMQGGVSSLARVGYGVGVKPLPIKLPFSGDISGLNADPRVPGVLFELGGWTRSVAIYAFNPQSRSITDTGLQPLGKYDHPADLVAEEVAAKAADGTLVPLSLVYRKGLKRDGGHPTILSGYGAFGISELPYFRPTFLPWFNRSGVLAVCHVRGGGENGQGWYKAGFQATKPNTWNDAIACAQWLIEHKITTPARLAIYGGSAGGILVGRAITERPELFAAAIDDVPTSDMVRTELSANGITNITEFGSVKTDEGFRALYAMSPYHHVKDGEKYPAVLVVSGINDPRVDAWEPAKMAARLMAASKSGKPVLLRIDYDAGHGFGTTKTQAYQERADIFAFLLWQMQ